MIPFIRLSWGSFFLSTFLLGYLFYHTYREYSGLKMGLDFSGGMKLEIILNERVSIESLRSFFKQKKIEAKVQASSKENNQRAKIEIDSRQDMIFETEAKKNEAKLSNAGFSVNSVDYLKLLMIETLALRNPAIIKFVTADKVGPTVGEFLKESAIKLLLISLLLITLYITFRFRINFALGALASLLHDLLMTLGFIGYFQIPLSVPVIAALLTILGYSINDTIVIFDRIRENLKGNSTLAVETVVDHSINASISRTLVTSMTTLIAVSSVYFWGGEGLNDMAIVLIIGVIIGTYSSSFIASPIMVWGERIVLKRS